MNSWQDKPKTPSWVNGLILLIHSGCITVVFAILEIVLYRLSLQYVVYDQWVSWYFPVGLRVLAYLLMPFKFWPALFISNFLGQLGFNYFYYGILAEDPFLRLIREFCIQTIFLIPIFVLKKKKLSLQIDKMKSLLWVAAACLGYRLMSSTYLLITDSLYSSIPEERKFEMIIAHILGGFVGIFMALLICYVGRWAWGNLNNINKSKLFDFTGQFLVLFVTILFIYTIQPQTLYLLKMLAILPLVWFAYRFGWIGSVSIALGANFLLLIHLYNINSTEIMLDNQPYLISYSIMGLLIGALVHEHKLASCQFEFKNKELERSNASLLKLSEEVQLLAKKLINVQEHERKALSQELHDEIGQNITALNTSLKIMQRRLELGRLSKQVISQASDHANQIYSNVYDLMHWLRPRALDELGLRKVLTGKYFEGRLRNAGISYHAEIKGEVEDLSEDCCVAIFRICQEAITNTIKHSQATEVKVLLNVEKNVELVIQDNGIGLATKNSKTISGFGLNGIEERVMALGGSINFNMIGGLLIVVRLP